MMSRWWMVTVGLLLCAGCGGAASCPDGSGEQAQRGQQVMASRCVTCHSSTLSGAARSGAPEGYDFDDPAVVQSKAGEILDAVESGRMPKSGALSAGEIDDLTVYVACTGGS